MTEKTHSFWDFVTDEAKKWTARVAFAGCAALLVLLFTPWQERLQAIWDSPDRLASISDKLDYLTQEVMRATGEDRVIHEAPGLTYVTEPVYVGDRITLNIVVRRTRTGAACTLLTRTALFTDETNIATPGPGVSPSRQVGDSDTPMRLRLDVPHQLRPGRVTVHLSLEFDCGGKRVFDRTAPVAFMLLERD
ncbi:hypothetical protein [Paracoccus seriniphilus]|nr:hypothetical protein [Paracoccus seriniphilus]WCR13206.1 hypothetical protein JHW44_09660 [Paracoccus seriniphilus]